MICFVLCCVDINLVYDCGFFCCELVVLEYCLGIIEDVVDGVFDGVVLVKLVVIVNVECILEVVEGVLVK